MATLLQQVNSRINHLKTCKRAGYEGESLRKHIEETRQIILSSIENYTRAIPVETASALINSVVEDNDLFVQADRCAILDAVNSKTCQQDTITEIHGATYNDRAVSQRGLPRQSMYNVENYLTQKIWHRLREPNVNRSMVYLEITRLLVQLGLHRPQEKFWGHLVGTLQWAMDGRLTNPLSDRDQLKKFFVQCRAHMNAKVDAPTEYPVLPSTLLEEYPALYHRTYVSDDQPILPPASMDVHTLNVLKSTTGCRSTRRSISLPVVQHQMLRHLG